MFYFHPCVSCLFDERMYCLAFHGVCFMVLPGFPSIVNFNPYKPCVLFVCFMDESFQDNSRIQDFEADFLWKNALIYFQPF